MKQVPSATIANTEKIVCNTKNFASVKYITRIVTIIFLGLTTFFTSSYAQNEIAVENSLTGNPASEWDISGAGDLSIQGFATDISVNKGNTVHFKIKTTASNYTITIYRLGYYGGNGARKIGTGVITASLPQTQPTDLYDATTGLADCGNWSESAHWDVPANAVSGLYLARLKNGSGGASHIAFVVRNDASHSNLFFQTSDATWQAYNVYGGNSLYVGSTSFPGGHASKVSYNRPFITRNGGGGGGAAEDWLFNSEYPMIRWLERNGYDMTYTTDVDQARQGNLILNHKVFMSVGHDEYWSAEQRNSVEAARAAGVHLAFFGGNECYWKTRWENSTDGSNTPYRTLVCYKEGTLGENQCNQKCDPLPNVWTGLWRDGDPATYGANDGHKPENALSGQISWDGNTGTMQVPDTYKNLRFWRNTSVATLSAGQTATLTANTLGYEWDWEQYTGSYPAGRITMSSTSFDGHVHKLSLYKHSSGALVFGAGTVQWSWGLDGTHDRGGSVPNATMQQATVNLFADMGVQPTTLQSGLTAATTSTDNVPPTSVITSPASGASLPKGTAVTITGTASDIGGVVAGVEVSVDGGTTWQPATGTTNWTFNWTPNAEGSVTIKSRGVDDIGNLETGGGETPANTVTVNVTTALPVVCPCTVFQPTDVPTNPKENDGNSIELGFKFRTSQNGFITSIRFYKGAGTSGTHSGHLWSSDGTLLANVTFTGEGASGWQQVDFATPVAVTSGTTYVASVFSSSGDYAFSNPFFTQAVVNGPLTALANGDDGPNGLYKYTSAPAFPTDNYQTSNYWIDVVFNTNVGPDITPPVVASISPSNGAVGVNIGSAIKINFNEAIDAATINSSTLKLFDESNTEVPSTITYANGTYAASLVPSSLLTYSKTYTVTVKGGSTNPFVKDISGNALASDYRFSFTTVAQPPPPPTEGLGGPILVVSSAANPFSRYPVEILRAEGLNEFKAMDISLIDAATLNQYDVVILGEMSLSSSQVAMFTNWTNAGGTFIAFRPDAQLSSLLGITPSGSSLTDKYLLVNTATTPGAGIVNQTIQYHGPANLFTLNGATSIATLYTDMATATTNPAVTMNNVGTNGGVAIAFAYDLARSIVYTRQGNPAWAGQKRDGQIDPIRSDDMFYPNWIDFNKIAIPQADEQQHLLTNLIIKSNLHRKPLPKFWFLPKDFKAAVVMTGDDHGDAGMKPRFDINISESPVGCSIDDWECIRSTGYLYVGSTFTDAQAKQYTDLGFEVALHINTNCNNFTPGEYQDFITNQSSDFHTAFPDIPLPSTNRNHCIAFPDWSTVPELEAANGMRLDANYYYWPGSWIQNRPGMFTGSGMPMRFAKIDGSIIDCYQVVTQMPDESGETFPQFCDALLDKATGPEGYYGVFTTNMHFDNPNHPDANAVVASAKARGVPVVSAKQMLTWLDGRNNSAFGTMIWNGNSLSFSITPGTGARNLQGMMPVVAANGQLTGITRNGSSLTLKKETIKGIEYAFFAASAGSYVASYAADNAAPVISQVTATPHDDATATITWTTDESTDSRVDYGSAVNVLTDTVNEVTLTTSHTITLDSLTAGAVYYYRVTSADAFSNATSQPAVASAPLSFIMPAAPCINDITAADFSAGTTDVNTIIASEEDGEIILKPAINEDFSGTSIPASFTEGVFNAGGTTVSNGMVTVNGTHIYSNSSIAAGSSLEFVATFNAGRYQNIGISADQPFDGAPWIVIGQGGNADGNLYARSSNGDAINLGSDLLGAPHHFLIKWNADNFAFYVDGNATPSATISFTITQNMFVQISDVFSDDGSLSVDWLHVAPYAVSGTYTSNAFDGGTNKNWGAVTWNADLPTGTSLAISVRKGNTPVPDGSWTSYVPVAASGNSTGGTTRYIQYKADLQTTNTSATPVLKSLSIACSAVNNIAPAITQQPLSQTVCSGNNAIFSSDANGNPAPSVQWQVSTNGTTWTDIANATNSLLTITVTTTDNGKKYRAVWSNTAGSATSSAATVTVNPAVTAALSTKVNPSCKNNDGSITIKPSGGTTPYQFSLNGGAYKTGNTFTNLPANTYTVTVKDAAGCTATVTNIVLTTTGITVQATKTASSSCGADGTITLSASGGKTPYTYSLDGTNFVTTNKFTNVAAGTYTGYAKDAKGCTGSLGGIVVTSTSSITVKATKTVASSCKDDGTLTLSASGGKSPYTYSLNGTAFSSSNKFTSLAAGTYTCYAKDTKGCTGSLPNIIITKAAFTSTASKTNVTCKGANNGTITVNKAGGFAPYTYSLNGLNFVTANKFTNLAPGVYTSTVKDGRGCTATVTGITITESSKVCSSNLITNNSGNQSLSESTDDLDAVISPNPSESDFALKVRGNNKEEIEIRVIDIYGRGVYQAKGSANQSYRFGQNFTSGTYIVELWQGTNRKVLKVIKQ